MPVTPPYEIQFLNDHKNIEDAQLHPPLGFRLGNNDTGLIKSIHGELEWQREYFQKPVIGFLDLGSSVSPSDGDRYIAIGVGSTGDYAGATANDIIGYLATDSYGRAYNAWDKVTPLAGTLVYATSLDTYYYYDGSLWKDLAASITPTDKDNATVTLDGGANNGAVSDYVDLFTPSVGKIFESVLLKSTGLLPSNNSTLISVVLHNGTPANDVEIMPQISTEELDGVLFKNGCNGEIVGAGYSLKLLITGNTVTAGTVLVVANYLI